MTYSRQDLANYENLELAWKRIQTSTSYEYKRLNEDIYTAFAWNLEENIKCFSEEIAERIYQPVRASKYYLPKKSNLVRPITVLSIKDQIYYQAIVNLICKYKVDDIRQFRGANIFGGFNFSDPNSIFFLSDWREEYDVYKTAIKKAFEVDYKWLCKFDLASFYDVIDHRILIDVAANGSLDEDLREAFFECLQVWTQPKAINFSHSHGIPQGPVASQVLADIYLHFLDRKITRLCFKSDLRYFRYVDDIVLMSKSEKQAQASLIKLDIAARELALIPQSGKISIREVKNIQDELKGESSLFDVLENLTGEETTLEQQERLLALLLNSVVKVNERLQIIDETSVKYSLNRLLPHHNASEIAVEIAILYPHLTDPCIAYLSQCELDQVLSQPILEYIKEEPIFDWHTARLLRISANLSQDKLEELTSVSARWILDSQKHWFLRREAAQLSKSVSGFYNLVIEELEGAATKDDLASELPYFLTLLKLSLQLEFELTIARIESVRNIYFLPDDFYIFIGYYSAFSMQELPSGLKKHFWISNNLFIGSSDRSVDGISHNLADFYKLSDDLRHKVDFRDYLAEEYQAALENLYKARGFFEKEPDLYFAHTNSFNQILLARIHSKNGTDISKFKFELGNMIGKLKSDIPHAFSGLDKCRALREDDPAIHAYNQTKNCLNQRSSNRFKERDSLKGMLAGSYEAVLIYIAEKHSSC